MKFNKYQAIKQNGEITNFLETSKKAAEAKTKENGWAMCQLVKRGSELPESPIWKGKFWSNK